MADVEVIDGGPVWYRNNPANHLSESPIYRHSDSTLHWIDILDRPCKIYILAVDADTGDALGEARVLEVPFDAISVICFRKDIPGSYICGYKRGIALLDEKTGEVTVLKELTGSGDKEGVTMNDGAVDPQGRFWIGEVDVTAIQVMLGGERPHEGASKPRGRLWRYEADGTCTQMETGITCVNGVGWSPDGKYMYFNDSGPQILWRYEFDSQTGDISNRTKIIDGLREGVFNDGMVISQDGNLWLAMFMDHCIMVYSPDGNPLKRINLPAECVACPTWGGKEK